MKKCENYGGLDIFKIISAFLVVSIHTSPFSSVSQTFDFIFTRVIARIAVPFFLMVTGYFVLSDYTAENTHNKKVRTFFKRNCLLYIFTTILYFPIGLYAGQYKNMDIATFLKRIFFDGTFYHLWYFPAVLLGIMFIAALRRVIRGKGIVAIALGLYIIGLLGDSYYGIVSDIPVLSLFYDIIFKISSYTRNGIFYAPLFLLMGVCMKNSRPSTKLTSGAIFFLSMILMIFEGLLLHYFDMQRHDSMYITLPLCMYFLFDFLLSLDFHSNKYMRNISTYIYLLHPAGIIAVRGSVKITHLNMFIDNSILHYLTVCILSALAAVSVIYISSLRKKREFKMSRAWAELNMENLRHNAYVLKSLLPENCRLMPAVKANAYGHGAVLISKELNRIGIDAFCVASVSEGVELRIEGVTGEILILGYTSPEDFGLLNEFDLIQTVVDYKYAKALDKYGQKVRVHIKIDSGMHRLGERSENIENILKIFSLKNLDVDGIFTHMSSAESRNPADEEHTFNQAKAFDDVITQINKHKIHIPKVHMQSSYGVINYPELAGDYARVGIAIYGMLSSREDSENCKADLRPVLSVKALVAVVKEIHAGEHAGYGLQFTAEHDMKIAVLTIGYADGIPRRLASCGGRTLINGKEAPIIGRICMDQMLVDVSDIPEVKADDTAVLIGRSGKLEITACELAEKTDTIANEILSRLGSRLERIAK